MNNQKHDVQMVNYICHQSLPMVGSEATGIPLVKLGSFGADMLLFYPFKKTCLHTHPGNHILFVVNGFGELIFGDKVYKLNPETCYLVPGDVPHQVLAKEQSLTLLSVADNHQPVDSDQRLTILEDI